MSSIHFYGNHFKRFLIPAGIGLVLIAALSAVIILVEPEALSPDEIIAKQEWTDKELQDVLAKTMSPTMALHRKGEIIQHLNVQMKKRSAERQEAIRLKAVAGAVSSSLEQIRKMPEQERNNMIKTIHVKAENRYNDILHDRKRRKEAEIQFQSKEMEAFSREVNRIILSELTPEERIQFAPVTKLWIRTMQMIGH